MRDVELPTLHLLQELPEVVVVEGERAHQQRVQDDPAGPHVRPAAVVLLPADHLRAGVVRGAAGRLQHGANRLQGGHAEVGDLDVVLVVQQKVLGLQVTVTGRRRVRQHTFVLLPHLTTQNIFKNRWTTPCFPHLTNVK